MEYQKQSVIEDIKGKKDLISEKHQDKLPVARIDFLSFSGKVCSCEEYATEQAFLETLNEELHYGVPLNVILYRDQNGKTISRKFLEELDTLPKELREEDVSLPQISKKICKETER